MKESQANPPTAKNIENNFDRGGDVLDYFDVSKARLIDPQSKGSAARAKFAYPVKRNPKRLAAVREKSARYSKKK